uniref:Uncharacterized protein AlNc14C3G436 n=1 Tax=Albugo laibachii Nc14 TaxID=890382 RepID=F0VZV8_9STRA|nr:conserved hypothetical protein [Albugo laibachii Nc14]|eukprot:CCA14329.1 conserved hypothetical protein [Albugo laibachii Nc14]
MHISTEDAEVIGRILTEIESQQEKEQLPFPTKPIRIYKTPRDNYLRVLDTIVEPINSKMLIAVDAFLEKEFDSREVIKKAKLDVQSPQSSKIVELQNAVDQNQLTWSKLDRIEDDQTRPGEMINGVFQGSLKNLIELSCSTPVLSRLHVYHDPGMPIVTSGRRVVYWQRNTLRTDGSNFGLLTACCSARALNTAVVAVTLLPNSIILPAECAKTATEAYNRASYTEYITNMQSLGIPVYGITPKLVESKSSDRFSLMNVFATFDPCVIITDDAFNVGSVIEVEALCHNMREASDKHTCPLLAVDSQSCIPIRTLDREIRGPEAPSLAVVDTSCCDKARFSNIYTDLLAQSLSDVPIDKAGLKSITDTLIPSSQSLGQDLELEKQLDKFDLELIDWFIVKGLALNDPLRRMYTASEGAKVVESIISHLSSRPSIQEELRGGGIMSLQPFIRHGTLSTFVVMQKIIAAISSTKSGDCRKRLAALKVLQSRAMEYLARDRDYALYLSMQFSPHLASRPQENRSQHLTKLQCKFPTILHSLDPSQSYLNAYLEILPKWVAELCLEGVTTEKKKAMGDTKPVNPLEYELSKTEDSYWNDIQAFLYDRHYQHPLMSLYWGFKIFKSSASFVEALMVNYVIKSILYNDSLTSSYMQLLEALVTKCSLGASTSPDEMFLLWVRLFDIPGVKYDREVSPPPPTSQTQEQPVKTIDQQYAELETWQEKIMKKLARQPHLSLGS